MKIRDPWPRRMLAVLVVVLLAAGLGTAVYPRQTKAYLTHWKGSPRTTDPYVPAAPTPSLRVAVVGDVGDSGSRLTATAQAVDEAAGPSGFDVLALLGDNAYPDGDPRELPSTVFEPFGPLLRDGTELLAIVGNHDVRNGNGDRQMRALGMEGRWWAKEVGDVLFVGLDSNSIDDLAQRTWLVEALRASNATWKLVLVHHPPYSAGYQGSDLHVREVLSPIFEQYGVDLVLSGHDHDYQRSEPVNGVVYIVSGAAAGSRRTSARDYTAKSFSWHHFVELDIYADHLVGRAVTQSLRVADEWSLNNSPT